jgi:hypothetical protein
MGVRILSNAPRSVMMHTVNPSRSTTLNVQAICDGQATKWCENLADNEVWLDMNALYRGGGTMVGASFGYVGSGSVTVKGTLADRHFLKDIFSSGGVQVAAWMAPQWATIETGTLAPGQIFSCAPLMYSLVQLVFTGSGSCDIRCF